jgi:hypothetical protein
MLTFSADGANVEGRSVRECVFEERSTLAVSAACLVANTAREMLASSFGAPVDLRLFEPIIPSVRGWSAIVADARVYAVSGLRTGAAIIVRDSDALAIARAAFAEFRAGHGALSGIESAVLDRIVATLSSALPSLHGPTGNAPSIARVDRIDGYRTFFELLIVQPTVARIGIALSAEPVSPAQSTLPADALSEVAVELSARTTAITLPAQAVASLEVGDILPMNGTKGLFCELLLAGRSLGSGECGVAGAHYALRLL